MRALLLLNGDLYTGMWNLVPELTGPWDLIICADGGGRYATELGITPHVLLGDFDSLSPTEMKALKLATIQRYPVAKDETDAELAVWEALRSGATHVVLAGALGGRMDHAMANLGLLRQLHKHGVCAIASDGKQAVLLATPQTNPLPIPALQGEVVSVLPLTTTASGVTLTDMRWPLEKATLEIGTTRSVSNEVMGNTATVSVQEGELLVFINHGYTR